MHAKHKLQNLNNLIKSELSHFYASTTNQQNC